MTQFYYFVIYKPLMSYKNELRSFLLLIDQLLFLGLVLTKILYCLRSNI